MAVPLSVAELVLAVRHAQMEFAVNSEKKQFKVLQYASPPLRVQHKEGTVAT